MAIWSACEADRCSDRIGRSCNGSDCFTHDPAVTSVKRHASSSARPQPEDGHCKQLTRRSPRKTRLGPGIELDKRLKPETEPERPRLSLLTSLNTRYVAAGCARSAMYRSRSLGPAIATELNVFRRSDCPTVWSAIAS